MIQAPFLRALDAGGFPGFRALWGVGFRFAAPRGVGHFWVAGRCPNLRTCRKDPKLLFALVPSPYPESNGRKTPGPQTHIKPILIRIYTALKKKQYKTMYVN